MRRATARAARAMSVRIQMRRAGRDVRLTRLAGLVSSCLYLRAVLWLHWRRARAWAVVRVVDALPRVVVLDVLHRVAQEVTTGRWTSTARPIPLLAFSDAVERWRVGPTEAAHLAALTPTGDVVTITAAERAADDRALRRRQRPADVAVCMLIALIAVLGAYIAFTS